MATTTPMKLTAAEVMTPAPRTCSPFSSVVEAVLIFRDADCGAVPIVQDGTPIGILTDRDVALALSEFPDLSTRSVADIMTKGVVSVAPGTPLDEAAAKFSEKGVRRLLVVDAQKQLLGIIAWADIAPHAGDCEVGRVVTEVVEQP
jgi:CBS domain-containing protein